MGTIRPYILQDALNQFQPAQIHPGDVDAAYPG